MNPTRRNMRSKRYYNEEVSSISSNGKVTHIPKTLGNP
jgi:hypothetical protein